MDAVVVPFIPTSHVLPNDLVDPILHCNGVDPDDEKEPEKQPRKRRGKKSMVWDHFTLVTVRDGCIRACCTRCKKSFAYMTGNKVAGTSHLKRHIALGICPASGQERTGTMVHKAEIGTVQHRKRHRATPGLAGISFDQERCVHEIAKMIVMHDYPLHSVKHPGFIEFLRTLQPQFSMVSFNSIEGDCVEMFLSAKQRLLNFINEIPGRISLALDMQTSEGTVGYVFLTGHFIDSQWNFGRRILNVVMVPCPDSDTVLNEAVVSCLSDWNLENRLFSLALDQSLSNDIINDNLKSLLPVKNQHILGGQLSIQNCSARFLSGLALDALAAVEESVKKIRDSVKFVRTSITHEDKFFELKENLQVPSTRDLNIDDQSKWNKTYDMLIAALEIKDVFDCFGASEPAFMTGPSTDDWKRIEIACKYLRLFYDAANTLTAPTYPAASTFFHELSKIQQGLTHAAMSEDPFISNLTKSLKENFDRYWNSSFLVLAAAVVMDPRFKMQFIEITFSRIYGKDAEGWVKVVDNGVHELFFEYAKEMFPPEQFEDPPPGSFMEEDNEGTIPGIEMPEVGSFLMYPEDGHPQELPMHDPLISAGDGLSDFEVYLSEITGNYDLNLELQQYLEESLLPREEDFDILGWWKLNQAKYPVLSKMASDFLSIPLSTVGPDSVFGVERKKMGSYHSSLHPLTVEALICAKDWLQHTATQSETNNRRLKGETSIGNVKMEINNGNLKLQTSNGYVKMETSDGNVKMDRTVGHNSFPSFAALPF